MENAHLLPFEGKEIRKVWYNDEWYFNISDVIAILTDSKDAKSYWRKLKQRLIAEGGNEVVTNCHALKFIAPDGKSYKSDAINTEGILRIVMSVPSPKAEPLKMWLAEQGKRTIDETNDPELITERQAEIYKAKGYSDEWITRRMQSIDTRKQLTDEWKKRAVKEGQEFSILTATIAKGTFGLNPTEHSKLKGLKKENLRDHMTPMELILTALGEESTRMIAIEKDAQGFDENHDASLKGGEIGNKALKNVEQGTGVKVVSNKNFLPPSKGVDSLPESTEPIE
jgi:DNA-damage-inducible protein D